MVFAKQVRSVLFAALASVVALDASAGEPVGFREQCRKHLWVTYRSFKKELERTGQFAAMGITNRCFFAVHTKDGGEKTVRLRAKAAKVVDLLTGETVAEDAESFDAKFATPDTRLFGLSFGRTEK